MDKELEVKRDILSTGDLELLIHDVREHATETQKQVMASEMRALSFGKRLKTALKIVFKR